MKEIFTEYAEINDQIKQLEEQRDLLKAEVISEMEKNQLVEVDHRVGKFYFTIRNKWEYPEKITTLEEKIKLEKAKAEEKGVAKIISTTKSLVFRRS